MKLLLSSRLLTVENSKGTSTTSEIDHNSVKPSWKSDDKTSLPAFPWGEIPSDAIYSGYYSSVNMTSSTGGEYSSLSQSSTFGQRPSHGTHRFSLDVGAEEFLANNANQPGDVFSSPLNPPYVPFSSSVHLKSCYHLGLFFSTKSINIRCSPFRFFSYST